MLSARLTQEERQFVAETWVQLDGMPYVEKAQMIRESLEAMRCHRPGFAEQRETGLARMAPTAQPSLPRAA